MGRRSELRHFNKKSASNHRHRVQWRQAQLYVEPVFKMIRSDTCSKMMRTVTPAARWCRQGHLQHMTKAIQMQRRVGRITFFDVCTHSANSLNSFKIKTLMQHYDHSAVVNNAFSAFAELCTQIQSTARDARQSACDSRACQHFTGKCYWSIYSYISF